MDAMKKLEEAAAGYKAGGPDRCDEFADAVLEAFASIAPRLARRVSELERRLSAVEGAKVEVPEWAKTAKPDGDDPISKHPCWKCGRSGCVQWIYSEDRWVCMNEDCDASHKPQPAEPASYIGPDGIGVANGANATRPAEPAAEGDLKTIDPLVKWVNREDMAHQKYYDTDGNPCGTFANMADALNRVVERARLQQETMKAMDAAIAQRQETEAALQEVNDSRNAVTANYHAAKADFDAQREIVDRLLHEKRFEVRRSNQLLVERDNLQTKLTVAESDRDALRQQAAANAEAAKDLLGDTTGYMNNTQIRVWADATIKFLSSLMDAKKSK